MTTVTLIKDYVMAGDGCQAPGAIVLRERKPDHPMDWYFVVRFRNDQTGGEGNSHYIHPDNDEPMTSQSLQLLRIRALAAFEAQTKRSDPSGELHKARVAGFMDWHEYDREQRKAG